MIGRDLAVTCRHGHSAVYFCLKGEQVLLNPVVCSLTVLKSTDHIPSLLASNKA